MLITLVAIVSQHVCVSNNYVVYLKLIQCYQLHLKTGKKRELKNVLKREDAC